MEPKLLDLGGTIVKVAKHDNQRASLTIYTMPYTGNGCYEPAQVVDVYLTPENLQALLKLLQE